MASKKIAQVLLCRCSKNQQLFGITMEKRTADEWEMMYSYPIEEQRAKFEGFDKNTIKADIYLSPCFKGCPFCQNMSFFQCGICDKINCDDKNNVPVDCAWCKSKLTTFTHQDKVTVSTGED